MMIIIAGFSFFLSVFPGKKLMTQRRENRVIVNKDAKFEQCKIRAIEEKKKVVVFI